MIKSQPLTSNKKSSNEIDKKKNKDALNIDTIKKKFMNKALEKNNEYRNYHGVKELSLDEDLYKRAWILAKQILEKGENNHDNNLLYNIKNEPLNMLIFKSEKELTPEKLMEIWYKESENYNFQEPESIQNKADCEHFTQMVWKNTKKFGIGYYCKTEEIEIKSNNSNTNKKEEEEEKEKRKIVKENIYYVALYFPQGNIPNKYSENVSRKIKPSSIKEKNSNIEIGQKENKNVDIGKNLEKKNSEINKIKVYNEREKEKKTDNQIDES